MRLLLQAQELHYLLEEPVDKEVVVAAGAFPSGAAEQPAVVATAADGKK
jgi:hypothetical protein